MLNEKDALGRIVFDCEIYTRDAGTEDLRWILPIAQRSGSINSLDYEFRSLLTG